MPLPASGALSVQAINAEFALGNNLNVYRGVRWFTATTTGLFASTNLGFDQFYGKQKVSAAPTWNTAAGSLGSAYTQQVSSFTVSASSVYGTGITYSIASGSIATGQSLNASTGVITGTASGVADYTSTTFSFTIRATNAYGNFTDRAFSYVIASRYTGYRCTTGSENATLSDTAPAGNVFNRKDFSSYGTPNGTCGAFTIGSCNSVSSNNWSPTLPATSYSQKFDNINFGDPCGGTVKRTYVQMSWGPF